MATSIVVNSENWPVNVVLVDGENGEPLDRAATETLSAALHSFTTRREPYANIIDLTRCGGVPASERQFIAERFNLHMDDYRRYLVAVAVILRSTLMRGTLTAIGWVHRYPSPIAFVANIDEAEENLKGRLAARGIRWSGLSPADRFVFRQR